MSDYARIPVKPDTANQLSREKRYGETWDDLARRLLEEYNSGDEE